MFCLFLVLESNLCIIRGLCDTSQAWAARMAQEFFLVWELDLAP